MFAHISTKTKVSPSLVHEGRHLELNHLSVFDKFNVFVVVERFVLNWEAASMFFLKIGKTV